MAAVTISNLTKRFGDVVALDDVSLTVRDGEFLTLLGPSGCGKSTLLRIIAGLDAQDCGTVAMDGAGVDHLRPKERDVAMVFQSYALYPHMTVAQNIALPLVMRRLGRWQRLPGVGRLLPGTKGKRAAVGARVATVADALGIAHLVHRKPGQLSGGQRQRVALGRAMVREPAVFLMDEPLSNLDAKLRVQMRAEIAALHHRLGTTFLYVTHDQVEAMTMSDRVAVVMDGAVLQLGTPGEIYADPADLRVANFVGHTQMNTVPAVLRDAATAEVAGVLLPLPGAIDRRPGSRVTLGIRPEALSVAETDARPVWHGEVALVEHLGADALVHVALADGGHRVMARVPPAALPSMPRGGQVRLKPACDALLVFDADGRRLRPRAAVEPLRTAVEG